MKRKVRKMKLSGKITATSLLVAIFVSLLISGISIGYMRNYLLNISQSRTLSVAKTAAAIVNGDQISGIQVGDEGTEDYNVVLGQLQSFLLDADVAYIYTMRQEGNDIKFVVDADTEEGAAIGEEYEAYDKIFDAFAGEAAVDDEVTSDEWGSFYSAFAPIFDSNGKVAAIVGVDCSVDSINAKITSMVNVLVVVEILCVLAAFIISMINGQLMAKNVLVINRKMEELAGSEGDLTQEIQIRSGDEIEAVAESFNSFMVKLRGMMLSVKDNGERLESVTNQTNRELHEATDELNQISNALNEMTQTMQETSDSVMEIQDTTIKVKEMSEELCQQTKTGTDYAGAVSQTAEKARQRCQDSKEEMTRVIGEMSDTLADKIEASLKIQKIMDLTKDIISISSQTRMLALNASIEAARAGEDGRGFAVVADQVGNLADATAQTAKEIESINTFTVDTVNELVDISQKMIHYVQDTISLDYDKMVEIGQAYYNDSTEFMGQFKQFSELSEQFSGNMDAIEGYIQKIMAVVEEETATITNIADASDKIYGKMQTASSNGNTNEDIVGELGDMLDKFIV